VKHKLNSLKKKEEMVCGATRICFVDGKEFLKGMKREHMCFSMIPKDSKEEVEEAPIEIALLQVYQQLFFPQLIKHLANMDQILLKCLTKDQNII